ncbi:MSMEG_1061 family FMN-dependent PPOX-type flavoprotein [Aquimarina aquimarini]|uniref:MSMEG_1061 family FMN-dependent PPOX-type flavoprotein n=1 Tax=Aquimarina aquimarini TaxID=1191734 RepID=UPI001F37352C|nr:MSMEG_1061 family FMN-dependent PPOX-type flavoprotein [Aquimarina aquimarini]
MEFKEIIKTEEQFRKIMGHPSEMVKQKTIDYIDSNSQDFINRSPFIMIASSDLDGNFDISPKGDPSGFVKILNKKTIAIPDRLGNRKGDTFMNVLKNPNVGLIFLIPGVKETLRISGEAQIVADLEIREQLSYKSKLPKLVLIVTVKEVFMHCAKCIIRSKLWEHTNIENKSTISVLANYLSDNTNTEKTPEEINDILNEDEKTELY